MEDTIHAANDETRTRAIPGETEVTAIFFDFKTGAQANAGTDARVIVRIGERFYPMPGRRAGHDLFERGGVDVIGFPTGRFCTPKAPRLDLDALRKAPIVLSHDGTGKCPAWYVERMSLLVRLAQLRARQVPAQLTGRNGGQRSSPRRLRRRCSTRPHLVTGTRSF